MTESGCVTGACMLCLAAGHQSLQVPGARQQCVKLSYVKVPAETVRSPFSKPPPVHAG